MSAVPPVGPIIVAMLRNSKLNDRIASALRLQGFGVLHVGSPDAAMAAQLLATDRVHLLITDDSLDEKAGGALFHRMGLSQARLAVLYISGEPIGRPLIDGVSKVHFLSIPFSDAELLSAVAQLLVAAPLGETQPGK